MATELKRKLDYDDYARLPDDGKRYVLTPTDWPDLTISLADLWR